MSTREVCTLQFGHYSNFVGAHWWNLQEFSFSFSDDDCSEINNRVLYREGLTLKGQHTYTPRLLLVDLNGSLNSLAEHGELYDTYANPEKSDVPWDVNLIEVEENAKKHKNEFLHDIDCSPSSVPKKNYNFEENVKVWSDCLYTRFHPNTINIIKQCVHQDEDSGLNYFTQGKDIWKAQQFNIDFSDKVRNFIEECDNMQGFHVLLDATDGFAGLSSSCIDDMREEYERKSILAIPVLPSHYKDYFYQNEEDERKSQIKDSTRVINLALLFGDLIENSSLFVPLSTSRFGWRKSGPKRNFNHISYNDKLMYHTSAILASALDTFTLKYRLKQATYSLSDLCADLNLHNRKLAAASLCLPFSFNKDGYFIECLDNWDGPLSQSISPNCSIGTDRTMQLITLRGVAEDRLKIPSNNAGAQKNMPAYICKTVNEMLTFYMSCTTFGTATNVTNIANGLTLRKPFPNFFDSSVGIDGNINAVPRNENESVQNVPVLSGLHSGKEIGEMLGSLHAQASKLKIERFHQFLSSGLEKDEYQECLEKLLDFKDCYEDNYLL